MKTRSHPSNLSRFLRCRPTTSDDSDDFSDDGDTTTPSLSTPSTISPYNNPSSPFVRSPWVHSSSVAPLPPLDPSPSLLGSLIRPDGHVYSLAVSRDLLLTGSDSKNIRAWTNLRESGGFKSSSGLVKSIVLFRDLVFSGHQDGKIRVWKRHPQYPHPPSFTRAATLPRFSDLLKTSLRPSNYLRTRRRRTALWLRHFDAVSCLALDPQRGLLYSASWDRTVKLWRISDFSCLASVTAHDDAVNAVAAAFGNLVLSGSADGTVKAWESDQGGGAVRTLLRGESAVTSIAVAEKDGVVYCGASDGWVRFWVGGRRLEKGGGLRWHSMAVLCLAAAGRIVVSGSADRTVRVWRREGLGAQHVRVAMLTGHVGPVKCLAVEEDVEGGGEAGGRWLVYSGSLDGSVRVWRVGDRPAPAGPARNWSFR